MKKVNVFLLVIMLFALFASSCTTTKSTSSTAKTLDVYGAGVIQLPVVVDLEVNQEKHKTTVSGTSSVDYLKNEALMQALKESNADVFVEPTYELEIDGVKKTVTIQGYPAYYKNFRTIEKGDVELLDAGIMQLAETKIGTSRQKSSKPNSGVMAALTISGIVLLGIIITSLIMP